MRPKRFYVRFQWLEVWFYSSNRLIIWVQGNVGGRCNEIPSWRFFKKLKNKTLGGILRGKRVYWDFTTRETEQFSCFSMKTKCHVSAFLHCRCHEARALFHWSYWSQSTHHIWLYLFELMHLRARWCHIFGLLFSFCLENHFTFFLHLQPPLCPWVLLLLQGENTFSSRFDSIDSTKFKEESFSLSICPTLSASPTFPLSLHILL